MTGIGSLCSGYGGLDQGLQAVIGGHTVWHVEHDPDAAKILALRYPGVPNYGDITATDWAAVPRVDWLTAGYPCQPFSHAGQRKGSNDERHLWPHMARAIGVLRPGRVLLENVRGHLSLGLDAVLGDLVGLGYDARWGVVRASDAGAPHGRARVFLVGGLDAPQRSTAPAHATGDEGRLSDRNGLSPTDTDGAGCGRVTELHGDPATRLDSEHRGHPDGRDDGASWGPYAGAIRRWQRILGRASPGPTEPGRHGQQRLSPRFVEWMQGLPDGWVTDVPGLSRNAQLAALGNGCVPQQVALAVRTLLDAGQVAA